MYTMKDFINKPIVVRVGQTHKEEFLKMCEAEGLRWMSGAKATEFTPPNRYGEDLSIAYNYADYPEGLGYADAHDYGYRGIEVIDFKDIKPNEPRYQIIIDCDGKTTTAKMLVDGKEVKTGVAKYNPADKFDFAIGAKVAFDRLWAKPKPEPIKAEPAGFKVGDRVKCIKVPDGNKEVVGKCGTVMHVGKCGTVMHVGKDGRIPILVEFDDAHKKGHSGAFGGECRCKPDHGWWCDPEDLELVKDEPFPFKVGDRVKCTKLVDGNTDIIGKYGTVIHLKHDTRIPITVEFDTVIAPGHNGLERVKGKGHHCWCCPVDALELVTVREVKRFAKVGEYIKIVADNGYLGNKYKNGDILKVVKVDNAGRAWYEDGQSKFAYRSEYVVLEGYVPPVDPVKPEAKFKVGDRVVCICSVTGNHYVKHAHGTIRAIDRAGMLGVEFDCYIHGHNLGGEGKCKSGHGLWCVERQLQREYREVKRHAKAGEWVKIVKPDGWTSEKYKKGDILKVKEEFSRNVVILSCDGTGARDEEYVVLEGYEG